MRTLQEQLQDKGLAKEAEPPKERAKPKERFSDRDLAELMGSTQATFRRGKGGAIRRNR